MRNLQEIKRNIDPTIVVSTVIASVVIGGLVVLARKAGLGTVATVAKGG